MVMFFPFEFSILQKIILFDTLETDTSHSKQILSTSKDNSFVTADEISILNTSFCIFMEELSSTLRIDALRKPESTDVLKDGVKNMVNEITSIKDREDMGKVLLRFFPAHNDKTIRDFFINHPIRWFDLIRKLSKYRKNDSERGWFLQDDAIEDIYTTFLVRGREDLVRRREDVIGERLRKVLPEVISKNQELLRYASTQPSVLDLEGYAFSHIEKSNRESLIRKLVTNGFSKNIDGCFYRNLDTYFEKVFPEILRYLYSIF
jgi:hypothetical protein